jgi:rhodanese-related sulfurtransferase
MGCEILDIESWINKINDDVIILDIRTKDEFESGTIPNSINIDFFTEIEEKLKTLDKSKTYLTFCRSGGRSSVNLNNMREKGFENVYDLQGGILNWIENEKDLV